MGCGGTRHGGSSGGGSGGGTAAAAGGGGNDTAPVKGLGVPLADLGRECDYVLTMQ